MRTRARTRPHRAPVTAGPIGCKFSALTRQPLIPSSPLASSNRNWVRLEIAVTPTKQSPDHVSNRNKNTLSRTTKLNTFSTAGDPARARSALDCGSEATALPTSTLSRIDHAPSGQNVACAWGRHSCLRNLDSNSMKCARTRSARSRRTDFSLRARSALDCGSKATALPTSTLSRIDHAPSEHEFTLAPVEAGQRSALTGQPFCSERPISNRHSMQLEITATPTKHSPDQFLIDNENGLFTPLSSSLRRSIFPTASAKMSVSISLKEPV
jgi:hypothetical protein